MRANTTSFSGVVSALRTHYPLGSRERRHLGYPHSVLPSGVFHHTAGGQESTMVFIPSLTGFGFSTLSAECPTETWPANAWKLIMRVKVNGNDRCTNFNVVSDPYAAGDNKSYYVSLNGVDKTGIMESAVAQSSPCGSNCSLYTQITSGYRWQRRADHMADPQRKHCGLQRWAVHQRCHN